MADEFIELLRKIEQLPDEDKKVATRAAVSRLRDAFEEVMENLDAREPMTREQGERLMDEIRLLVGLVRQVLAALMNAGAPTAGGGAAITAEQARAIALAPVHLDIDVVRNYAGRIERFVVDERP